MKVWFEATNLKAKFGFCNRIVVWCKLPLDWTSVLCGNIDLFHVVKVECVHSSIDGEHAGIVRFVHFLNFCRILGIVGNIFLVVILVVPCGCASLKFDVARVASLGICLSHAGKVDCVFDDTLFSWHFAWKLAFGQHHECFAEFTADLRGVWSIQSFVIFPQPAILCVHGW